MKKYTFFSDPGHGWLRVPKKALKELNIEDKISSCSYEKGQYVYLEEDCDASVFFEALKQVAGNAFGRELKFQDLIGAESYSENTAIRRFRSYQKPNQVVDKEAQFNYGFNHAKEEN